MISTRLKSAAVLTAAITLSSVAGAQTFAFTRTELGRVAPTRFATTTQQFMASLDVAVSMPVVAETANSVEATDLVLETMPAESWGNVPLHADADANDDGEGRKSKGGFFTTTTGRVTLASIAGLAGAGYYALNGGNGARAEETLRYTVANNLEAKLPSTSGIASLPDVAPGVIVNPEPATIALMAFGLGAVGLVARKRRTR